MKNKELKKEANKEPIKMRQILIETDGKNINIIKAEVAGEIEFIGILSALLNSLSQKAKN